MVYTPFFFLQPVSISPQSLFEYKIEELERQAKAHMPKRSSKYLRTAAFQAAEVAALVAKDPMFNSVYEKQRSREKKHMVAVSHAANKMIHVVFSVLKNRKPYKVQLVY